VRKGRNSLKRFPFPEGKTFRDVQIKVLSEHTKQDELDELVSLIKPSEKWGLISDAGLPCLADPGARLVALARRAGIDILVHMGPSSIIMALMLSGLGAQKFCFEGYLPRRPQSLPVL
jgi:16S rRNA (cytidine1402-2'-O)-methyltransferase